MSLFSVFLDECHFQTKEMTYYLSKVNPNIVMFQISTYDRLEFDMKNSGSPQGFRSSFEKVFPKRDLLPCVDVVSSYVIQNNPILYALGLSELEIKSNFIKITSNPSFIPEGICSFIIGSAHENFVREQIEPIAETMFDDFFYCKSSSISPLLEGYKSSSCPSCSK